jgi:hypothetical protein
MQFPESWEDNYYPFCKGSQDHIILGLHEKLQKEYQVMPQKEK